MDFEVQIGWGKAVPLPPTPFYVAPDQKEEESAFIPDPPSGMSMSSLGGTHGIEMPFFILVGCRTSI